jgi:hypothetical protein
VTIENTTFQNLTAIAAPPVSAVGEARIYLDSTTNKVRISQNGGAYVDMVQATPLSLYGDGSDGDVTLGPGTTTLVREMYYNNLTVPVGSTLATGNHRVFVRGTATIDGIIQNNGGNGGNAASGAGGSAGAVAGGNAGPIRSGTSGSLGRSGNGTGTSSTGKTVRLGGAGGAGGAAGINAGGGTSVSPAPVDNEGGPNPIKNLGNALLMCAFNLGFLTEASSAGQGGGSGAGDSATSGGGGGGGGGGSCVLVARTIAGTGTHRALGGNGGTGFAGTSQGGGGGGGGGGIVVTISDNASTLTDSVAAGTGGAGAGGGGAGVDGAVGTIQHLVNA